MNTNPAFDCVLWGGYSFGNVGDEITLAVAIHDMRERYQRIAVISRNPEITQWTFPEIAVIPFQPLPRPERWKIARKILSKLNLDQNLAETDFNDWVQRHHGQTQIPWIEVIQRAQTFYLVGGGYLTDLFHINTVLLPVYLAKNAGVTIRSAPLGIGPFKNPRSAARVSTGFEGNFLVVRDQGSLAFCKQNRISATLREDDGYRVAEVFPGLLQHNGPVKPASKIGVCLFYQDGADSSPQAYADWCTRLLKHLASLYGSEAIEGFCFHTQPSLDFHNLIRVFANAGLPVRNVVAPFADFRDAVKNLSNYRAIITSRYHAAVVASSLDIPCFAIASGEYYATKMKAALRGENAARTVVLETQSPESITEMLGAVVEGS